MRKLTMLFATLGMVVGLASSSQAATVTLTSGTLGLALGALPPITLTASGVPVALTTTGSGGFTEPAGVFGPTNIPLPRSLFTGVPQISGLTLGGFGNNAKAVDCTGANCIGTGGLAGKSIVNVLQLLNLSIPLSVVGQAGGSIQASAGSIVITVLGQGWTSGTASVGAVTTTTPGTNVVHTVTQMGSDSRVGGVGQITLVSGFQAITNVAGTLPGFATQILRFTGAPVPEPGTLLLIGTGVAGLALLGRRRMR